MIYLIGNKITSRHTGLWNEGKPYSKENIYSKKEGILPPVNYDKHIFKPHSLTHCESPRHTSNDGKTLDYYIQNHPEYFYGECIVLKFDDDYTQIDDLNFIKKITIDDLSDKLSHYDYIPPKILITTKNYQIDENGYHKSNFILILESTAAEYFLSKYKLHLFGTSWKSTDFQPGKFERPIHEILFKQAIIFELLNLKDVPEGKYIFSGMPLYIENSVESPVCPFLISS